MKHNPALESPEQCRRRLIEWYRSPQGSNLKTLESGYLSRVISFRYNQAILQMGSLGWEDAYRLQDYRCNLVVVDDALLAHDVALRILGRCDLIPIDSESIDVVILPHCLEFESDQHGVLREADRVLKPEGQLIVLGFNPWSIQSFYHFFQGRRGAIPWCGSFLSYPRLRDWLSLLNFETSSVSGVYFRQTSVVTSPNFKRLRSLAAVGYGIKAIKRRYNVIPLSPAKVVSRKLVPADVVTSRVGTRG